MAVKTALTRLGVEANWAWMTEKGNLFHAVLSLCHTSSTSLAEEEWLAQQQIT